MRWPHLEEFCEAAQTRDLVVWFFGSALHDNTPRDLDVLVIYEDRARLVSLKSAAGWADYEPPLHIIAMTPAEEAHYDFVATTRAIRLV